MTCIVAVVQDGVTYVGGDAAGSTMMGSISMREDPKVIKRGDYVLGFTSSFRMGDILEFRVPAPSPKPSDVSLRQHLITRWIDDDLRRVFNKLGYLSKDKNVEHGGTFIIAYKGELCVVESDFQVGCPAEGYASVGSGGYYALGALHVLARRKKLNPITRVKYALEAAVAHNAFVRPKFTILET